MTIMNMKKIFSLLFLITAISNCSISPGMHMKTESTWLDDNSYIYIPSMDKNILIQNINEKFNKTSSANHSYEIGIGDQIAVTIWGLPDIFPITNLNPDQNLRRVDSNGNIFFPYAGLIKAEGLSQDQLRQELTTSLSKFFNEPQVDISIAKFNSKKVFILGEVTKPSKLNITDIPISLSDAIGESFGLNTITASGSGVFVIRQSNSNNDPEIFYADLSSPSYFIDAGKFYLMDNDIVYVNSNGTARWNKVISQFFPFSSFLNSVDNLVKD